MVFIVSTGLHKSESMSARSLLVFPVFSSVILVSVPMEILGFALKLVSLCRRAKTPSGYLSFSFRFELWKAPIHHAYKTPSLMRCAYMHLIKLFK